MPRQSLTVICDPTSSSFVVYVLTYEYPTLRTYVQYSIVQYSTSLPVLYCHIASPASIRRQRRPYVGTVLQYLIYLLRNTQKILFITTLASSRY